MPLSAARRRREDYNFVQAKKAAFLTAFSQVGNITAACEVVGVGRQSYYDWTEHDAEFGLAVERCKAEAVERLESEARRRAVDGWEEDVYQGKELVGTVRKYSDTLLIFLLKGAAPGKYRERLEVTQTQVIKALDAAAWDAV